MSFKSLHELNNIDPLELEKTKSITRFYGWIRRIRVGGGGGIVFIDIYDGTAVGDLKCVASSEMYKNNDCDHADDNNSNKQHELIDNAEFKTLDFDQLSKSEYLSDGCAVAVVGQVTKPPVGTTQKIEFKIHKLQVIGRISDPMKYPINKSSEKHIVALRQLPFMRIRSQIMQSTFRICSKLEFAVHKFMNKNNVQKIDPNILTMSDCEGAGETFAIAPMIFSKDKIGLTVSSQLPLESAIAGFKQVYTAQKSFRAEKSDTLKHLAEFFHIEYESAFITLPQLLDFTEIFVKYVIKYALAKCQDDFEFIESKFAPCDIKSTREFLTSLLDKQFTKIKYKDAIDLIHKIVKDKMMLPDDDGKLKKIKLDKLPKYGDDLNSEHEKLLVKYFGWTILSETEQQHKLTTKQDVGAFVFLTHWPLAIKSFYMKQCDDDSGECESFDLLAPRVGELFGGSMREWRFDKLNAEIMKRQMDITPIQWFVDLRKNGSMPHGGWGMGFARLCMLVTGMPSVRDTVYLPVYYGHCPY